MKQSKGDCMKRNGFLILFLIFLVCEVFGQTRSENRWMLGNWAGTGYLPREITGVWGELGNFELILNDNGTGRWTRRVFNYETERAETRTDNVVFSIIMGTPKGNTLILFDESGHNDIDVFFIYRINDQRMVLQIESGPSLNLNKRN